jgi:peptidoglycan/LPS O-acetylase OafA/YrhL
MLDRTLPDTTINPARVTAGRNHGLDLLRGCAALLVCAYHSIHSQFDVTILSMGTFTVYTFFTLSAVTMTMVYGRDFSDGISADDLRGFYKNRFARIAPLLIAFSLIHFFMSVYDVHAWTRMLLTSSGLFALHMPQYLSATTGAWSLGIEIGFYLIFPIVCMLSGNVRRLVIALVILIVAQQLLISILRADFPDDTNISFQSYSMPLTFAPYFAFGILIARVARPGRSASGLYVGICLLLIGALFSIVSDVDIFRSNKAQFLMLFLSAGAVWAVFSANIPDRFIPCCSFLGNISYALYLTHWYTYIGMKGIFPTAGPTIAALLYFSAEILIAFAVYTFFERPMRNYLRR